MGSSTKSSDTMGFHAPRHPVSQLQGPFEESLAESINETADRAKPDASARRKKLLEGPKYERVCAGRWKQKPGEKFHPLWKISAQMSFGVHLLAEGLAKSEDDVMTILQTHVDDVDGFLESTAEDFDLAQSDIAERLRYLKMPLEHVEVFDRMLEDRAFRVSIVQGNEKIEHIMVRTTEATNDALKDIQKGIQATNALGKYLEQVYLSWTTRSIEHDAVFVAMVGNVEGWRRAFEDLFQQGNKLSATLLQLASIISEMQRRAGIASRKALLVPNRHGGAASRSHEVPFRKYRDGENLVKKNSNTKSPPIPSKPLPKAPPVVLQSTQTTRRTSFQESRSEQASSTTSEERHILDSGAPGGQVRYSVSGDRSKQLKDQKSAPDLKPKSGTPDTAEARVGSQLRSLGVGSGLGLGRMMDTNACRPVIIEKHSTHAGSGSIVAQVDLNSEVSIEHSAEVLNVPIRNQAPVQKKRLSFPLKAKIRDRRVGIRSTAASPKAPGNLLKSSLSPQMGPSSGSADGPSTIMSPVLSPPYGSPNCTSDNKSSNDSPRIVSPNPGQSTPISVATPKPLRMPDGNNPTFTSHPPNMAMVTSLPLKEGQSPDPSVISRQVPSPRTVPELDSENTSYESSLGEPGPEVSATDEGDKGAQKTKIAELDSGSLVVQGPVELEAATPTRSQSIAVELGAPQQSPSVAPNAGARMSSSTLLVGATIQSRSDFFKMPPQQTGSRASEQAGLGHEPNEVGQSSVMTGGSLPQDNEESSNAVRHRSFKPPPEGQTNESSERNGKNVDSQLPASGEAQIASLNSVPDRSQKDLQHRSSTPEEQASAINPTTSEENETQSTVRQGSLQLPSADNQQSDAAGADRIDETSESDSAPRDDRQMSPSGISTEASEVRLESKQQSPKHHPNLFEIISHTPPESPIHERPPSSASSHSATNSARLTSYRASIDLAPPGPGGRDMVNPDYASAGAFEGEKRPKRASGSSMSGLKIFSGSGASHSRADSVRVVEIPEGRMSGGGVHDNVDLMTPDGSNVLWFKGMGGDGVWVSGN